MRTTIFTAGCWDLFHVGHLRMLQQAKALGNFLVVGVNTDEFMQSYKEKPIIPFEQRREIVAGLECVDIALPHRDFEDLTGYDIYDVCLRAVGPQYGKYEGERQHLKQLEKLGIRVVVIPRTPDISASDIRRRCHERLRARPGGGRSA